MGWFSDLKSSLGDEFRNLQQAQFFQKDKGAVDPSRISPQMAVLQGTNALYDVNFDAQGNLIRPQYRAPGDVTMGAVQGMVDRSMNDPLQTGAEQYMQNVLGGGVNPYLSQMYDQAAGKVRSSLDSQFERAGRYGGAEHEMAMGGALGDLATNLYGGQYQSDMDRRMQAAQVAPGLGYAGLQRQYGAGQIQDEMGRQEAEFDYDAQMQRINQYLQSLGLAQGATPAQGPERNKVAEGLAILTAAGSLVGGNPAPAAAYAASR